MRANGGGIYFLSGTLTINNSTFTSNSAAAGGGIVILGGTATINNSTFSGNSSALGGGGIYNGGILTLNNSTLSGNSASSSGGGIKNFGTLALTNTIVATNDLYSSGSYTGANNLTNGDPLLAPLGNYGGPTQTMPPLPGSPAIDAGDDSVTNFLATDQRGFPRKSGAHVDIGSVEVQVGTGH